MKYRTRIYYSEADKALMWDSLSGRERLMEYLSSAVTTSAAGLSSLAIMDQL